MKIYKLSLFLFCIVIKNASKSSAKLQNVWHKVEQLFDKNGGIEIFFSIFVRANDEKCRENVRKRHLSASPIMLLVTVMESLQQAAENSVA